MSEHKASVVDAPGVIRTPDQRLRVFVSSTLDELADERAEVRATIQRLRLAPVMFELGARPHPPRALYRAYLEQSHIFIGIYWQSYGWVAPEMGVSGIEDEYELAAELPCLVYVKEPARQREPRLQQFIGRLIDEGRVSFKQFESTAQLTDLVADDLAVLLTEHFEAAGHGPGGEPQTVLRVHPLPAAPTRLVGRERDLDEVSVLIEREDVRLLTLSGVGGIGKTRLALAAASDVAGSFRDGVAFADLSSIRNPELVPAAVAAAVGVSEEGTRPVAESLRERLEGVQALLVLDNFEQVIAAGPFVSELLSSCPGVKVMVTSRALLGLRGEHEFRVMPLETPPAEAAVSEAATSAAARLFVERAQDSRPEFALAEPETEAVAELCRRLEGIPLAIELAAARVRILPAAALLERIGDRLDLLTGPRDLPERQRTLRATLDWSYDLLDQHERDLFAELSVFVAGFTLEGAQAACGGTGNGDVLEGVSSLVEKSLVVPLEVPEVEPRFRMLETVREYAQHRLEESGREDVTKRRMARYLASFAERAGAGLRTSDHRTWVSRVDSEAGNIRSAVSWAFERGEFDLCIRLEAQLWIYGWARGLAQRLRPIAERILELDPPLEPGDRALLLWIVAACRIVTGDSDAAIPLLGELLDLQRVLGDEHGLALARVAYCACAPPEASAEARATLTEAEDTLRRLGDLWGAAFALATLVQVVLRSGDAVEADRITMQVLEEAQAIQSDQLIGTALNLLGLAALSRGEVEPARAWLTESARLHNRMRSHEGLAYCLDGLAALALAEAAPKLAAKAIGAADAIRERFGFSVWPIMRSLREPIVSAAEGALGAPAFEAARAAGAETDPEQVVEELLGLPA